MKREPRWLTTARIERTARFMVPAEPAEVFPLLCPVLEYDWIPDWRCEMIYSKSGAAELGAMFKTRILPFGREHWTCVRYEPPKRIEYLFTHGSSIAVQLELELAEESGKTALDWTMRYTIVGALWRRLLRKRIDERSYLDMMRVRERQLADYFSRRK
jgi:hypothetical protein